MNIMLDNVRHHFETAKKVNPSIRLVSDANSAKATFENIAIIGLGYVGLPLAVCLADKFNYVRGVDISERRVNDIVRGHDETNEISADELAVSGLELAYCTTSEPAPPNITSAPAPPRIASLPPPP